MCKTNQQYKYYLARTICVIDWKDRRKKQVLLISPVFGNIVIREFTGKHFMPFCIATSTMNSVLQIWSCFILPLTELRKVAENCQKQLALIINPLVYREIHCHWPQL